MPSAAHYSPVARWAHNPNPTNLRKPLIERSGARPMDEPSEILPPLPIRKGPAENWAFFYLCSTSARTREIEALRVE